jgi:hypothetical protein
MAEQPAEIDGLAYMVGLVHGQEADHAADGSIEARCLSVIAFAKADSSVFRSGCRM